MLYCVNIEKTLSANQFQQLQMLVSAERVERVKRFIRYEDQCRSLVGEALARFCVQKRFGISNKKISFTCNSWGKPLVANTEAVHFSISHSGNRVVCGCDFEEIGVDVERIHAVDLRIADRFFTSAERTHILEQSDPGKRQSLFFAYWVVKESFIKAVGRGLSCGLNSFSVKNDGGVFKLETWPDNFTYRYFRLYDEGYGYPCALCLCRNQFPDSMTNVEIDDLIIGLEPVSG